MTSATFTQDDGTVVELHDQAYTDGAVAAAIAALPVEGTEFHVKNGDKLVIVEDDAAPAA